MNNAHPVRRFLLIVPAGLALAAAGLYSGRGMHLVRAESAATQSAPDHGHDHDHKHDHHDGKHDHDDHDHDHDHDAKPATRPATVTTRPQSLEKHDHEHGRHIELTREAMEQAGVKVATAGPGELEITLTLPGEIMLNTDRLAHIVPRVPGMVREVHKNAGEIVKQGELLAFLESRELAESKAAALAAKARLDLAKRSFARQEELWAKKIIPEQEFLESQKQLSEADIDYRSAEAKLHALGITEQQVSSLDKERRSELSRYELRAPFAGTVIQKHIALGEYVTSQQDLFVLADLKTVWANITVFARDAATVREGQTAIITALGIEASARGEIFYVSPIIDERTRTTSARAVILNPDKIWKPGLFVSAAVVVDRRQVKVLIPDVAIQRVEGQSTVFVQEDDGFEPRPVVLGRTNGLQAEVLRGLSPGEKYVSENSFIFKAELGKGEAEHAH